MIEDVVRAVLDAGEVIEEVQKGDFDVSHKGSQGPVTEADRRADDLLRKRLLAIESCGWLSEETADNEQRFSEDRLWVVDPLDGTKEFVEGVPQYAVAVALVEKGKPVLAVVHNPATGETISAESGSGTWQDGTKLAVVDGPRLLASRSEVKRGEFAPFMESWEVDAVGSIEYKLALVASGRASGTISRGPKWEWDVCAGALLVSEAGGRALDAFGEELVFNQKFPKTRGVMAGTPEAIERLLEVVNRVGASDRMSEFER